MDPKITAILKKSHYGIVGNHSAVKICHWMRQSLYYDRPCYKQTFYGIETHRCLQMTPAVNQCTQNCLFCWRYQEAFAKKEPEIDDPKEILDKSILEQRRLLTGYKGEKRTDQKKWQEAQDPKHIAISLTGEPTLYPRLNELIEEAKKRGMTVFLVTNGTTPEVIENLDSLPTLLYITVAAPNQEIYKKLLRPTISKGWERLNKTLEILPSLNTKTVIRHTLVDKWNLGYVKEYTKMDLKAEPTYIESKGYVFVGYSRQRMNLENMPSHENIMRFSKQLSDETGYKIANERKDSRVVLLQR